MVYTNPNEAMQEINTGPAGTPIPDAPSTTGNPPASSGTLSSPTVVIQPPNNSVFPGSTATPPPVGSVAGSLPTPQTSQTTPQTPTVSQIMSNLGPSAGQYGTSQATPGAQYSQVAQSYSALAAAKTGSQAPSSNPMQTPEVQDQLQGGTQASDAQQEYFDAYSGMNPITQSLYNNITQMMSTQQTQQSLAQEYQQLAGPESPLSQDQLQLMNIQTVMNGTQDDISNEIGAAGGTATQSQVMAITAARNNVIMKQASFLQNQLSIQQSYVQNVMQFTEADQSQVSNQINEQTGLLEQMDSIQTTMNSNSTSAYQDTLKSLGYNYTAFASSVPPGMQSYAEGLLGLAPGTLSNPQELANLTQTSQTQIADMYKAYAEGLPAVIPGTNSSAPVTTPGTSSQSNLPSGFNTVVGGIDFGGQATGTQPYATNIYNEVTGVGRNYNAIVSSYGSANPSVGQLQQYVTNNAPSSGITGQMLQNAAQQYGINPAVLAATLANETSFGTAGEALNGTNNPGGVMDPATGNYAKYSTWQEGVNAAADNLAVRQTTQTQSSAPTTSVKPALSTFPTNVQQFVGNLPSYGGASYATPTQITALSTSGDKAAATQALNALGIPIVTAKDEDALNSISSAQQDLTDVSGFINTAGEGGGPILPKDASGQPQQYQDVTLNDYLQVNGQLGAFDSWEAEAVPIIKGLSTGGGSAGRLFSTITESSFPQETDTLPTALDKIAHMEDILNNGAQSILGPNSKITPPNPPYYTNDGTMYLLGNDGTYSELQ